MRNAMFLEERLQCFESGWCSTKFNTSVDRSGFSCLNLFGFLDDLGLLLSEVFPLLCDF